MLQGIEKSRDKNSGPFGREAVYAVSQIYAILCDCRGERENKNMEYGEAGRNRRYHHRGKIGKRTITKPAGEIHSAHAHQQHDNNKQKSFADDFFAFPVMYHFTIRHIVMSADNP